MAAKPDRNLSDERAGEPVGRLPYGARSKDPIKQDYRDRMAKRPRQARPGDPFRSSRMSDEELEENSRLIFGGDEDDPRWEEHRRRLRAQQLLERRKLREGTLGAAANDDAIGATVTRGKGRISHEELARDAARKALGFGTIRELFGGK